MGDPYSISPDLHPGVRIQGNTPLSSPHHISTFTIFNIITGQTHCMDNTYGVSHMHTNTYTHTHTHTHTLAHMHTNTYTCTHTHTHTLTHTRTHTHTHT